MDNKLAPVLLFVYLRPSHTNYVLKALSNNKLAGETSLFIFHDGLKKGYSDEDKNNYEKVYEIINKKWNFKLVKIISRECNFGLSRNITLGVSEIIKNYNSIIVLEDDIVPRKGFLKYMNDSLIMYQNIQEVGCIHSWNYDMNIFPHKQSTFFLKGADCWGWGTWRRAWAFYENDGKKLLDEIKLKKLEFSFNRNNTIDFVSMLNDQINKKNDSWAIRWHASLFLAEMYCLHPTKAIVENIGLDGSGTHCENNPFIQRTIEYINVKEQMVKESDEFFLFFQKNKKENLYLKIKLFLKKLISKITHNNRIFNI